MALWPYLGITAFFAIIYWLIFNEAIDLNGDNASYYILGKSLNSGNGYTLLSDIKQSPHGHFPPGYPFLISVFMVISKEVVFIKAVNGLFLLGAFLVFFRLCRIYKVPDLLALVTTFFLMFNYPLLKSSTVMMSEIPFLFFSLLTLFLFLKSDEKKGWDYFVAAIISLSLAYHIRTQGIALLGGIIVFYILKKKYQKAGLTFFGFFLLALPWTIRGKLAGISSGYVNQLLMKNPYQAHLGQAGIGDFLARIGDNAGRYLCKEIPQTLLPFLEVNYKEPSPVSYWIFGVAIVLLFLTGMGYAFQHKQKLLLASYFLFSGIIFLLWPAEWVGTRFITPVIPFIMLFTVAGLYFLTELVIEKAGSGNNKYLRFAFTGLLITSVLTVYLQPFVYEDKSDADKRPFRRLLVEKQGIYPPGYANYFEMAEFVKANLPEDAVVACRKPLLFHLYSEGYTTLYPFEKDQDKLLKGLKDKQVDYVVLEQIGYSSTSLYLLPVFENNRSLWRDVHFLDDPKTYLIQLVPEAFPE